MWIVQNLINGLTSAVSQRSPKDCKSAGQKQDFTLSNEVVYSLPEALVKPHQAQDAYWSLDSITDL